MEFTYCTLLHYSILLLLFSNIVIYGNHLTKSSRISLSVFLASPIITMTIQYIYPHILIEKFGITICFLWVYLNLLRPDQLIDSKTGLMNSTAFESEINRIAYGRDRYHLILISINNLDYILSNLSDNYDAIIKNSVGEQLLSICETKLAFYLGDGKYALLYKNCHEEQIRATAKTIQDYINSPVTCGDITIEISAASCIIHIPDNASNLADIKMYLQCMSKTELMNNHKVYMDTELDIAYNKRYKLVEAAIEMAIANNSFKIYYQPIYDLNNKHFSSAEALIRLIDDKLGFIPPDEFIPIAEQSGQIIKIGNIVFENVCSFISNGNADRLGLKYIEINLSIVECMEAELF